MTASACKGILRDMTLAQPKTTTYVKGDLVMTGSDFQLRCPCGGWMEKTRGRRIDGMVHRDYMWHVCEKEPTHITEEIEISEAYWSAFTKTF